MTTLFHKVAQYSFAFTHIEKEGSMHTLCDFTETRQACKPSFGEITEGVIESPFSMCVNNIRNAKHFTTYLRCFLKGASDFAESFISL